ncbi:MAG: acylneuraminate cytidylyltransferase family protein [Gammaproteobacteria bacterium]
MDILAIIPARGGSKGIPRKNLVKVGGKPLITHSIEHALASELITRVVVSTDDEQIAKVSIDHGAEVPVMRPTLLAGDEVLDWPVFAHMLSYLRATENYMPSIVVHLRPTAPYRKFEWIDEAIRLLVNNKGADSVRSVSEPAEHPYRVFEIEAGYLSPIMSFRHQEPHLIRRQDHPKMYFYNCVLDVTRAETIFDQNSMTGKKMLPYIMRSQDVIDIDTKQDLEFANFFFGKK